MTGKKAVSVDDFLAKSGNSWKGGPKCKTCQLKNLEEIEAAAMRFNAHRMNGATTMGWATFTKHYLNEQMGYPMKHRAIIQHLSQCKNVDVHTS